jgi:UDP-N-acetylmuramyl tripeptide synthase
VAQKLDPYMLSRLAAQLAHGAIVVAGTNGKTTTSRIIADVLEANGNQVVHNRSGSNLVRGVFTAFAAQSSYGGHVQGDIAVVETDEAAFPEILRLVKPRTILLINLFRDQLDRYGELDTVARKWKEALAVVDPATVIVYNGDDPGLCWVVDGSPAAKVPFGLNDTTHVLIELPHAADAAVCRWCTADLTYGRLYLSHLGDWACRNCGHRRPLLARAGRNISLEGVTSLGITVDGEGGSHHYEIGIPGLYNAYNTLAAIAVCEQLGVPVATLERAIAAFRSAFGRIERVTWLDRQLTIALVKNPVGFNEVLRMLTAADGTLAVPTMIAINDRYADGRDVSWLWDVDFELLAGGGADLSTSGLRGPDMANRLKYAGVSENRIIPLDDTLERGLDAFIEGIPAGGEGYILPTYTAMLEIRRIFSQRGAVESFWEQ